ncbi:MAG: pyruvate formate-lyase-activating protein [Veillonellales bacterium]
MLTGCYHSMETFGTVDGQGIRLVLFLSGCRLSCKFCHNPDTWSCSGKEITAAQVLAAVNKYRRYYEASGGGITVSGGEPLLQPEFVAALFKSCQEQGIHTTLDTAGYCSPDQLRQVLPYTDAVLFSLKAVEPSKHYFLTGHDNTEIIDNLRYTVQIRPVTLRYVVIPGVNNEPADITALAKLIHSLPLPVPVELLAYHTLGRSKWEKLGWKYSLADVPAANEQDVQAVREQLTRQDISVLY